MLARFFSNYHLKRPARRAAQAKRDNITAYASLISFCDSETTVQYFDTNTRQGIAVKKIIVDIQRNTTSCVEVDER